MVTHTKMMLFVINLLLLATSTRAQIQLLIDDSNALEVMTFLEENYPEINISIGELKSFVNAQPQGSIEISDVDITQMSDSVLELDWQGPEGTNYIINTLDLSDGDKTSSFSDDTFIDLPLSNSTYLIGIGGMEPNPIGTTFIIVDKNILLLQMGISNDCECGPSDSSTLPLYASSYPGLPYYSVNNWVNYGSNIYKYKVTIDGMIHDSDSQTNISYNAHFIVAHGAFPISSFYFPSTLVSGECQRNVDIAYNSTFATLEDAGKYQIYINRNGMSVQLGLINPSVKVERCAVGTPSIAPPISSQFDQEIASIHLFPNPAKEEATLEYFLPNEAMNAKLTILNALGMEWQLPSVLENQKEGWNQLKLEVANWPAGVYYLQLNTGESRTTKTFIKQ